MDSLEFRPAQLWHYVQGPYVSPMRITPRTTLRAIFRGNLERTSLDIMIAVTETAKIINRITNKNELMGV